MRPGISRWAAPVAIVLLAIALHWSLLNKGFVSDDLSQVLNNPYSRSCQLPGQLGIFVVLGACGVPGRGRRLAPVVWPGVMVRRALDCFLIGAPALPLPGCGGQLFRRAVSLFAFGGFLLDRGSAVSSAACRLRPSFAELRPAHVLPQCRLAPGHSRFRRFSGTRFSPCGSFRELRAEFFRTLP